MVRLVGEAMYVKIELGGGGKVLAVVNDGYDELVPTMGWMCEYKESKIFYHAVGNPGRSEA